MRRCSSALLATLLALGGCATTAQQEVSRIQGIAVANAPVIDACWARAVASPPHQALKGKMGDNSDALTLVMKTNTETATPEESATPTPTPTATPTASPTPAPQGVAPTATPTVTVAPTQTPAP